MLRPPGEPLGHPRNLALLAAVNSGDSQAFPACYATFGALLKKRGI